MSVRVVPRMPATLPVLAPARRPWPEDGIVGPERVHRRLRSWLALVGHEAFQEAVPA